MATPARRWDLYAETTVAAPGSFVFGDASTQAVGSFGAAHQPNQFVARASGGVVYLVRAP